MSNFLQPHEMYPAKLLCLWNFPGKDTGMGCHFLLQEIFPDPRIEPVSLVFPIRHPPNQYSHCFHSHLWMCREWQNLAVCMPSELVSALISRVHPLHRDFKVTFFSSLQSFRGDFTFQNILQLKCCSVVSCYNPGKGCGVCALWRKYMC